MTSYELMRVVKILCSKINEGREWGRERKEIGVEGKLVPFGLSIGLNSPPL